MNGSVLRLTKHEGAGNDFLVVLDPDERWEIGPELARALCDRHRGVGADGIIRVLRRPEGDGTDLTMELRNADGTEAEMSGNGMRCLAQAAAGAGWVSAGQFTVSTVGGVRTVELKPSGVPGEDWASVDMGPVRLGHEPTTSPAGAARAREADVGNPHLVLLVGDPARVDLGADGPAAAAPYPGGINVEFVAPLPDHDGGGLALRVYERGAGETLACGTGSVAAAAVARAWGLVGDRVMVRNPGGDLEVLLGPGPDDAARLAGPVRKIAGIEIDLSVLNGGTHHPVTA